MFEWGAKLATWDDIFEDDEDTDDIFDDENDSDNDEY